MTFSLSSAYLEEMRKASPEPIVQVAIQTSVPSTKAVYFHNGHNGVDSTIEGDPVLQQITSVTQTFDAFERKVQVGTLQVDVIDNDYTRDLMSNFSFYNADCLVYLLGPSVVTTDAVLIFRGRVESVRAEEGSIIFEITEYQSKLDNHKSSRTYISKHPLEVIDQALQDVGIDSAKIDSTTFSPGNFSDISHYCFSSYGLNGFMTAEDADALPVRPSEDDTAWTGGWLATIPQSGVARVLPDKFLEEYCQLTQSILSVSSTGTLKMLKFDSSASVVHHFTVDEYHSLEQDPKPALYNVVEVNLGRGSRQTPFILKDATSITNYGEHVASIESVYLCPSVHGEFANRIDQPSTGDASITGPGVSGFAGTRNLTTSQVAADKVDADNPFFGLFRSEVLKFTSNTVEGTINSPRASYRQYNEDGAPISASVASVSIDLKGMATRPFAGSEATEDQFAGLFVDITAVYNFCVDTLTRFSNSAPKIKFTVGLEFVNVELGDLISIDNNFFVSPELRLNSLDSSVKFEVVGKEVLPVGDEVGIVLHCVYATKSSAPGTSISVITPPFVKQSLLSDSLVRAGEIKAGMDHAVLNGLNVAATSGLGFSIAAGALTTGSTVRETSETLTMTATACKHTYIGIDGSSGVVMFNEVATSADEPILSPNEIRLAKVVSDGSSVTSVVDLRRLGAITSSQFNRELLSPSDGILWNGGFEDWPDPGKDPTAWENTGDGVAVTDFARETSVVHSGGVSLKMKNTGESLVFFSDFIPIDSSQPYRASLWVRQTGSVTMRSDVFWYTSAKVAASTSSASITNAANSANNVWENRSTILTPGSDVAYAKIKLTRPLSPGADCYWDDVTLRPEAPSFRARAPSAGGGSSITKDTDTDLIFGTDIHDYGAVHDTSNGRFTAPSAGLYEFNLTVQVTCTGGEASMIAGYLFKNGSKFAVALGGTHSAGAFSASVTVASGPMELAKGDYITPAVFVGNRNATLAADPDDSYFSGRKIS